MIVPALFFSLSAFLPAVATNAADSSLHVEEATGDQVEARIAYQDTVKNTEPPLIEPPVSAAEGAAQSDGPTNGDVDAIAAGESNDATDLAFADESDAAVIERIVTWLESVDTLQGKFYQQAPSGTFSKGAFFIRRPGLLRFEYDPPTELLIVANGGTVFVRDEALKTTDSYPVGKTPLKFLLRKKIKLDDADITNVERAVDAVGVTLLSRDEETEGELTLVFSAPEISLLRWVVRDQQNGLTIVDLMDVVEDARISSERFRIPETESPFLKP